MNHPTVRSRAVRRRLIAVAGALVVVWAVVVSVAWATHTFGDVPNSSPHHDDVTALALAGITGGCAPGLYCPDQAVRRDQMASFLRRGLPRSAFGTAFETLTVNSDTENPVITLPIAIGLPPGAISGAAGFVQAQGELKFRLTDATGCPCEFRGAMVDVDSGGYVDGLIYARTVLDASRPIDTIPIVGRARYTTSGTKQIRIVAARTTGGGTAEASANLGLTYVPFGADGTNEPPGPAFTKPSRPR